MRLDSMFGLKDEKLQYSWQHCLVMHLCIFSFFLVALSSHAAALEFPQPSAALCEKYRQGPVVNEKLPIYYGEVSEDPASFYWADIWYRPEYLADPFIHGLERPDGLPERDISFAMDISTGQPLPYEYRMSADPTKDNFFSLLLLGGRNHLPISRLIAVYANAPEGAAWRRTGEFLHGYELIEVEGRVSSPNFPTDELLYVGTSPSGDLSVMVCDNVGSVPVPHCEVREKTESFQAKMGLIRVNQLDQLQSMLSNARAFTACLMWNGEE